MGDTNKRLQFDFPPQAADRLETIRQETSANSYAEIVRNALRIYEWVVETQKKGLEIGVAKDGQLIRIIEFLY